MAGTPIFLDEQAYRLGFRRFIEIDLTQAPHWLFAGRSGSGKTTLAKAILAKVPMLAAGELQPVNTILVDAKSDADFAPFAKLPNVYRGEAAPNGIHTAYQEFRRRQQNTRRNLLLVFVDEYAALVAMAENKAEREALQREFMLLAMMARSFHISILMATQQPSANTFGAAGTGVREQFSVCLLGNGGTEALQMLFDGESREKIKAFGPMGSRGTGWISVNGGLAQSIRVPKIMNMERLNVAIKYNLERE